MNLKDLIFGGGVKSGDDGGTYRDSIQAWLPIKNIIGGVVITKDGRFVKILELLPVNIYLKSPNDRQNIISSFAAYLKIAPNDLQMVARTLPADTQAYVEQMQRYAEKEDNEACREMIEDNIQEIGNGIASDAIDTHETIVAERCERFRYCCIVGCQNDKRRVETSGGATGVGDTNPGMPQQRSLRKRMVPAARCYNNTPGKFLRHPSLFCGSSNPAK